MWQSVKVGFAIMLPLRKLLFTTKKTEMDFLKKNVTWIAVAALGISVYLYWKMTEDAKSTDTSKFTGKIGVTNPINA